MARTTKDPEERKKEILSAAEELFAEKGYENTAVSEIVKKVGVAQGLFYYYYKSKEEILNALADMYTKKIVKTIEDIVDSDNTAKDKIHLCIERFIDVLGLRKKRIAKLSNYFHKEENTAMHHKYALKMIDKISPVLAKVVKQGVEEKVFNTDYPEEVTGFLLQWLAISHTSIKFPVADTKSFERKAEAVEDIVERVLGAEKGTMQFKKYVSWICNE